MKFAGETCQWDDTCPCTFPIISAIISWPAYADRPYILLTETGAFTWFAEEETVTEEIEIEEPRYLFKMSEDNMIEIYDNQTGKVVRKITPEEAAATVHNFSKLPSIFFNRDV